MLSSHAVGFQRPDNSNLANLTPGLCSSSWSWYSMGPANIFNITNGVKQGGLISPRMFTIYINFC